MSKQTNKKSDELHTHKQEMTNPRYDSAEFF